MGAVNVIRLSLTAMVVDLLTVWRLGDRIHLHYCLDKVFVTVFATGLVIDTVAVFVDVRVFVEIAVFIKVRVFVEVLVIVYLNYQ